jgi:arginase
VTSRPRIRRWDGIWRQDGPGTRPGVARMWDGLTVIGVLIEVPTMAGDNSHAAAAGPAVLTAAVAATGCRPATRIVPVSPFVGDSRAASIELNGQLAETVGEVVAGGKRPVVLAGSCDVAPGVWAGIRDPSAGVMWIDAHADFNTPESSVSGFWPGMTLAVLVGDCGRDVWSALRWRPAAAQNVALFGVRSLSPTAEAHRLADSSLTAVAWDQGMPRGDIGSVLDQLHDRFDRVYVHLDLDALDPTIGQGVVDSPVPGGLTASQLDDLITDIARRFTVIGATVATYTPAMDNGSTLPVAANVIRQLLSM